ncbi:MAG: acyltransferase, partial [Rhodobacteraceae bacterium CG17_big_fil_post_rev_8_21_14_2_50_63_15]
MTARLPYRPDIDGIRAIAVGLVVVFHFGLVPLGKAGFIGVDIFFVISGFLITRIVVGALERGDFSLGGFYLARIRRLYPALVTVLAGYLAVGWFLFLPDLFAELTLEAALSQLYVVNFHFWRSVNYFGLHADGVPLLHMWSLAVEEQFYIFYPVFLILLHRHARRPLLPILMAVMLASFALGWFATGWKPWAAFYLLPTRAWELLAGGVLALAVARARPSKGLVQIAGPVGLALIALTLALADRGFAFPGWFAALPVAAGVALLLSGEHPGTPVSRSLALPPMVWLGRISYP